MGTVGRPKMRKSEKGGWCAFANWHLINLTCSQVERNQGKGACTHTKTETEDWTWNGMYREKKRGEFLPEDIVVGLPSTTNPCPVNFMLNSPRAKRQFASVQGCKGTVSVGNRWCAAENQTLLLYFDMIYYFIPSKKQTPRAGRLQSCLWITHPIKTIQVECLHWPSDLVSNKCWQNLDKNLFSKWIDVLYRWSAQFAKLTWSLMSITAFLLARSVFCFGCFCEIISNVFKIPQITFSHHCWHVNTADWNFSVMVT